MNEEVKTRVLAVKAAHVAEHQLAVETGNPSDRWGPKAAALLLTYLSNAQLPWLPAKLAEYVHFWAKRFNDTASVLGAPHPGAPRKLTEKAVIGCLRQVRLRLMRGKPFESQAQANDTIYFKRVLTRHNISASTLWQRMHEFNSSLCYHAVLEYRRLLTPELKLQRVKMCAQWLRMLVRNWDPAHHFIVVDGQHVPIPPSEHNSCYTTVDWLNLDALNIIWIDEKTLIIEPPKHKKVWTVEPAPCDSHDECSGSSSEDDETPSLVRGDPRIMAPKRKVQVIKYCAAVSARHGAILIEAMSGTSGLGYTTTEHHKVRSVKGPARVWAPHSMVCSAPAQAGPSGIRPWHPSRLAATMACHTHAAARHGTLPSVRPHPSAGPAASAPPRPCRELCPLCAAPRPPQPARPTLRARSRTALSPELREPPRPLCSAPSQQQGGIAQRMPP
jgi:hypothetical protein